MVVFFVNIGEVLPSLRVVVVVVVDEEEEEVAAAAAVAVIVARLSLPVEVVVTDVGVEADGRDLREEVLLVLVEFVVAVPRFKGRVQALILELDELEVELDRDRSES